MLRGQNGVCVCVCSCLTSLFFSHIYVYDMCIYVCMCVYIQTHTYISQYTYVQNMCLCVYIHVYLFIYTLSRFPWSLRQPISDRCGIWKLLTSPYLTVKLCFTPRQWEHWMQKRWALWEWRDLRWSRVTSETYAGLYTGLGRLLCSSLLLLLPGPLLLSWNKLE